MRIPDAIQLIKERQMPEQIRSTCLQLAGWMADRSPQHLEFLTPQDISKAVDSDVSFEELSAAVALLSSSDFAVLKLGGYIDDPEEGMLVLEDEDLASVVNDGSFVHPSTGEEIHHARSLVRIFYSIRAEASA